QHARRVDAENAAEHEARIVERLRRFVVLALFLPFQRVEEDEARMDEEYEHSEVADSAEERDPNVELGDEMEAEHERDGAGSQEIQVGAVRLGVHAAAESTVLRSAGESQLKRSS